MLMTCNCGHTSSVDGRQPGQFADCPECHCSCLVRADEPKLRESDVPRMSLDGPLPFWSSNVRIAIDAENGMIAFDNCFVPDTGFWTLRVRSVESYTCSLSDVVRAFRYSNNIGGGDRPRRIVKTTEIVTTAGKARIVMNESSDRMSVGWSWKQFERRDDEGGRDERLQKICDYLDSEGYVSLEGTPPSHFVLWGVLLLVAVVMVIAAFYP
jgi:hypothetical protein